MNADAIFAQRNARSDAGLHRAAIVVVDVADPLVLRVMCMSAKNHVRAFFVGVSGGAFRDDVDRPCVMSAVVLQKMTKWIRFWPGALQCLVCPGSPLHQIEMIFVELIELIAMDGKTFLAGKLPPIFVVDRGADQ
jgi:hypothetical protein